MPGVRDKASFVRYPNLGRAFYIGERDEEASQIIERGKMIRGNNVQTNALENENGCALRAIFFFLGIATPLMAFAD